MEKASSFFESIVNDLGLGEAMHLQKIKDNWQRLFPPPMSLHTQPDWLKGSTLHINVDSHVWLQELHFYQGNILEKLCGYRVDAIRLRVGPVTVDVNETVNDNLAPLYINEDDRRFIDDTIAIIKDDALRATIKRTMQKAFSCPYKRGR
ncbi:MAG: DUF721 domain-containing protein [Nitrospirae bacterium]|nr:DUF721 domain-containing protein [Nitrospirota bacterium]MBF0592548.1 DUF721 domain-containing protein [Nitrospirota bacterium]